MKVGLTGGIASGKSLVSAELKRLGAHVIDADLISREITRPGEPAYKDIIEQFGPSILKEDGTIDRKALGKLVFSDPEKRKRLNAITHPRIIERTEEIAARIEKESGALVVVDAALLIEAGEHRNMDKVIVVYADEDRQIERLRRRDKLTDREIKERLGAQMPLKEKAALADYLIDNDGTIEQTLEQVRELYGKLCAGAGKNI